MKTPFRILFNNDTFNTLSCTSPYHKKGEPFAHRRLRLPGERLWNI